jgi:polysaccharide export outer membrane protein
MVESMGTHVVPRRHAGGVWPVALAAALLTPGTALAAASPAPAAPGGGTAPAVSAPVSPGYAIHPGDQLNVQVYGEQSLTQTVVVLPDGTITLPLVGKVQVAGKTPNEAGAAVTAALSKYLRHPVVNVAVATQGQLNVMVLGDVKTPGKYQVRSNARIADAIAAAGGLGPINGQFPDARVADAAGNVHQIPLQKLLHDGELTFNEPLTDGEVVYVPGPQTINVEVMGAVDKPGEITLHVGDRLSMAIAKAGNSRVANADLNRISLTRQDPSGKSQTYQINLYQALQHGDMRSDMAMQKGDVVFVPESKGHGAGGTIFGFLRSLVGL